VLQIYKSFSSKRGRIGLENLDKQGEGLMIW